MIANASFGFQVSESGAGYTWCLNSRENQLTPWSNDPVTDPPGEVLYVRDEETGTLWGPTVLPIREEAWPYVARHGQGYSIFEHTSHGISLDAPPVRPPGRPREDLPPRRREPIRSAPAALGDLLRRMGAGPVAQRRRAVHRHRGRPGHRGVAGAEPLEPRLRQSRRLRRSRSGSNHLDRRSDRVPRPKRNAGPSGGAGGRGGSLGPRGRRPGSVRRHSGSWSSCLPVAATELVFAARPDGHGRRSAGAGRQVPGRRRRRGAAGGEDAVGRHRRRGAGADTGPIDGRHAEPVAPLPDAGVSRVGAVGLLSGRRRVRLSGSAPGRHGPDGCEAGGRARAPAPGRQPSVRGRRRAALVAPAVGPGRANADLRRPRLATLRGHPLPGRDRRCGRAGRGGAVSRGTAARPRRGRRVLRADRLDPARLPVRALRASARPEPRGRPARSSPDRQRRLERRHEPGRRGRARRERLARMVPAHRAVGVRAARGDSR